MGRSTSCFKIITCGSDSADKDDDVEAPEVKGDKKGWSFRKRSARHRVLSNTVVSEASSPPDAKKGAPESADISFQTPITSDVPEKVLDVPAKVLDVPERVPDVQENVPEKVSCVNVTVLVKESAMEKQQELSSEDSVESDPEPVVDTRSEVAVEVEESAAVLIQTAVRAFLGQRELEKLKKVIKLQAVVRGHLVRNHAVGTLRCVQAIVKMQVLVRARRARMSDSVHGSGPDQKEDKDNAKNKPAPTYISINKLLSNRFARQLLDSTPKEKPIHMKCEISQTNSAWNWFERWMSASAAAPSPEPSPTSETVTHQQKFDNIPSHEAEIEDLPETLSKSIDLTPSISKEMTKTSVGDDNIIEIRESQSEIVGTLIEQDSPFVFSSVSRQTVVLSESPEVAGEEKTEEPKHSMKRSASDELENDLKKSKAGLKAANPAFLSAQSKFEELSSNSNDEKPETESGTELSISSTLDSPDHFNGGAAEIENDRIGACNSLNNSTLLDVTYEAGESTVAAETESHDQEVEPDTIETSQQESYVVSPERSMIVPESQGTPASQASVNTDKGSKRGPTHKRKLLSANKASPSHLYNNSGSSSAKQSGKDEKSSKRRGPTTSENVDREARDSSSSVPHFMQATQSAKAKISANNSPRSSPDVQDREVHVKKRLSLPSANGRQGSPRIQRSTSQTVPGEKASVAPAQERKWLR